MIYLDNASTSYPKPLEAIKIATSLLERQPLTLNRRGYFSNVDFVDEIELLRSRLKRFIGADKEDRLICVLNATEAINIALFSLLNPGDHVITSVYEHSAVTRTLLALRATKNITFDVVKCDTKITCQDIEKLITQSTKLVVLSHVSNVTGNVLIEKNIGSLLKKHGIKYLIDASQTIGNIDFNVKEYSPDILCFSGHKSLMGLTGTGFLYLKSTLDFQQFRFGGVGHSSELDFLPIKQDSDYEVGTQNVFGILFLNESLNFIENIGLKTFYMKKEQNLNYLIKKND